MARRSCHAAAGFSRGHPGGPPGLGVRTMGMRQRSVVLFPTRGSARAGSPRCSIPAVDDRGFPVPTHPPSGATNHMTSTQVRPSSTPQVAINDIGSAEDFLAAIDQTIKYFNDGDIVEGIIVKVDRDEVLLDIGYKTEGVIPSRELSIKHDV